MGASKSEKNNKYEDAMNQYNQAISDYKSMAHEYAGEKGYKKSVEQAKGTAAELSKYQAAQAGNQARTASRNAGMSKAQAAALGSGQAANAYNNAYTQNFNTQQQQVASQNSALLGAYGNAANMAQANVGAASAEYANEFNRNRSNRSDNTLGIGTLSDGRLKEYVKCNDILNKHKRHDLKSLKWEDK